MTLNICSFQLLILSVLVIFPVVLTVKIMPTPDPPNTQ